MKDPVTAWAAAALKRAPAAKALRAKLDRKPSPLAARFGLDPLERRILELAHAVERAFDVAKLARAAAGGLTVELVRATLGDEVDAALSPRRALRRHALVAVGAGGPVAAADIVRTAPGVSARLEGAADPEALWLGVTRVVPNGRGEVPARVAALLHDLDAATATLVTLDGCARRDAYELAAGLARSRGRGVLVVDGELVAGAPDPALWLACARREADCEGDALVVCAAAALGERWRALLAPAPATGVPLVLLADGERTRDPVAAAPFSVRRLSLHPPAPAAAAPVVEPARKEKDEPPADDGLEQVRQLAIRDAERALGIYRAPPPPPRVAAPPTAAARPPVAAPAAVAPPVAVAAPVAVAPPVAVAAPAAVSPPVAAPVAVAPTVAAATPPAAPRKMSAKAMQHFAAKLGLDPAAADDDAATRRASPPAPPTVAPVAAEPSTPPPVVADAAELVDGTPLPLAASATPEELARAALTSPSASQRIELIGRIRLHKIPAVVAALRANAANPHPGVRAAAEAAMAALFGPTWNTTRPVPKPVQRPPSDDKDRGPPGGY